VFMPSRTGGCSISTFFIMNSCFLTLVPRIRITSGFVSNAFRFLGYPVTMIL
jgi:hypothetical protein